MYISSLLNHFLFLFLIDKWYKGQEINLRIFFSNRVNYFTFFFLKPPALVSISIHFWSLWRNIYLSATDHSLHSPWGLLELADMPRIDLWWGNLRPLTIIFISLSKATPSKLKILTKNHVLIIQSPAMCGQLIPLLNLNYPDVSGICLIGIWCLHCSFSHNCNGECLDL